MRLHAALQHQIFFLGNRRFEQKKPPSNDNYFEFQWNKSHLFPNSRKNFASKCIKTKNNSIDVNVVVNIVILNIHLNLFFNLVFYGFLLHSFCYFYRISYLNKIVHKAIIFHFWQYHFAKQKLFF